MNSVCRKYHFISKGGENCEVERVSRDIPRCLACNVLSKPRLTVHITYKECSNKTVLTRLALTAELRSRTQEAPNLLLYLN